MSALLTNDQERNFTNTLISGLANSPNTPTEEQVKEKARQLAEIFSYAGDLQHVVTEALTAITTQMGPGVSLIERSATHDPDWLDKRTPAVTWTYANSYDQYLLQQGWAPDLIKSLDKSARTILSLLQDPAADGTTWTRRGLVIGHVQSGKTANYIGLITRAADAGYRFIIVIAGIHNNLRKQTQQRIEEAFIGRTTAPGANGPIGVGLNSNHPPPASLTTIDDDFSITSTKISFQLKGMNTPVIAVIKKNVSTLTALHDWLATQNADRSGKIRDVPLLMIDDEADNASINTNTADQDPTAINSKIREILGLFHQSCYAGYTATPFANIFINPDAYDQKALEDLFPRDFIHCLDAPTHYFGAHKIFIDDNGVDKYTRPILDADPIIPASHKRNHVPERLPDSLKNALDQFIVARAIRNLRGQAHKPCSMMVNVSRYVEVQERIGKLLEERIKRIKDAVQANYRMPERSSSTDSVMIGLKAAYDTEFKDCSHSWSAVKAKLNDVARQLQLQVINSKNPATKGRPRKNDSASKASGLQEPAHSDLTMVAVGGLSLSRGLTIEGLTISYMYRNTRTYDTLMQMGRWFGYRTGYQDLCRIYLPEDSINWYGHIAEAADDLINQVGVMRTKGLTPKAFGLAVNVHPDRLLITAPNKIRSGQLKALDLSLSGRLRESYIVSTLQDTNSANFNLIKKFSEKEFRGSEGEKTGKGYAFKGVATETILDFLKQFRVHKDFEEQHKENLKYLKKIQEKHNKADVLLISPKRKGERNPPPLPLNIQERAVGQKRHGADWWRLNKDRVGSRGDEGLGLSDEQRKKAQQSGMGKSESDVYYRSARNRPLLMLHSLQPKTDRFTGPIAAYGISFPPGDEDTTVRVMVNQVWAQQQSLNDDGDDFSDDA